MIPFFKGRPAPLFYMVSLLIAFVCIMGNVALFVYPFILYIAVFFFIYDEHPKRRRTYVKIFFTKEELECVGGLSRSEFRVFWSFSAFVGAILLSISVHYPKITGKTLLEFYTIFSCSATILLDVGSLRRKFSLLLDGMDAGKLLRLITGDVFLILIYVLMFVLFVMLHDGFLDLLHGRVHGGLSDVDKRLALWCVVAGAPAFLLSPLLIAVPMTHVVGLLDRLLKRRESAR